MPTPPIIDRQVAHAAGACFESGVSIRGVASAIGIQPSAVKNALDRGRRPEAPWYLQRMVDRYDAYRVEEGKRDVQRERLRTRLAAAAGHSEASQ